MNAIRRNTLPVRNPRTGEVDYHITPPTADEMATTTKNMRAAQKDWAAAPVEHRVAVMRKWADEIEASYAKWRQQDVPDYKPQFGWPVKQLG